MKLTKIHIENFGMLSGYDLDFKDGLTAICEDNGKGKTTIATFITVMLFGLGKNLKDSKEREHYYPFDGGNYGGTLCFTHGGDFYEIKRQFHKSSKAKDTVAITKNRKPFVCPEGKEIGEIVLGIDEGSFRRVCFINDNDLDFSQESIATKLGGLAGNFDAVKVKNTLDSILGERKKIKALKGQSGSLGDSEKSLSDTQYEISRLNGLKPPLEQAQKELHEAKGKRLQVRKDIASIQEMAVNEDRKKNAASLLGATKAKRKAYDDLIALYPKGMPSSEEVEEVKLAIREASTSATDEQKLSVTDEEGLKRLSVRFVDGIPSEEEIQQINQDIWYWESLSASLKSEETPSEAEQDIVRRFSVAPPTPEEITVIKGKFEAYRDVSRKYENTDAMLNKVVPQEPVGKPKKTISIALFAIGGLLAIGGVASCFFLIALGIVLIAVGAICLGVGAYLFAKKSKESPAKEEQIINPKKRSLGEERDNLRANISAWLSKYYINDPDPIAGMAKFDAEYRVYSAHVQGQESKKAKKDEIKAEIERKKARIDGFFAKRGYNEGDYHANLLKLQKDIGEFKSLQDKEMAREASEAQRSESLKKAEETILSFAVKYGAARESLEAWVAKAVEDEKKIRVAKNDFEEAKKSYEVYCAENPFDDSEVPTMDIEELKKQEEDLNQFIAAKENEINGWEQELEALDELHHKEAELLGQIAALKKRHKLLSCVENAIEEAQNAIKEKYVGPIKTDFEKYSKVIRETSGLDIDLDTDFELTYRDKGEMRKSLHLSDGGRTLVSFCLRLALLANMYEGSEAFVVLDDPFVALDGTNLPRVLRSLNKLVGSNQFLYLTCHPSRMPR